MRVPFVAANWKMNKTVHEALACVEELREKVSDFNEVEIVIAPPFTALHAVASSLADTRIGVSGQDLHWEPKGAFTGEISANMLKEAGAKYVIIGHSERRHLFDESNELVKSKIRAASDVELISILCVGETLAEREAKQTFEILNKQLTEGLTGLHTLKADRLIVAYEPVWAIGTGYNATPEQAQAAHAYIRSHLAKILGEVYAENCRIIYGGSVKPTNVDKLCVQVDVDGALVGGSSLEANSFAEIVARSRSATV